MLTSPFDNSNTKVKNRNKKDFQECDVVFVSDIFSDEYGIDNRLNALSDHPPIKAVFEFKSK